MLGVKAMTELQLVDYCYVNIKTEIFNFFQRLPFVDKERYLYKAFEEENHVERGNKEEACGQII